MGATACIVVPGCANRFGAEGDWKRLAWWVHDRLPYSDMEFFPVRWAFNLNWHEVPKRRNFSQIPGARGYLTKPGMAGYDGSHAADWEGITP